MHAEGPQTSLGGDAASWSDIFVHERYHQIQLRLLFQWLLDRRCGVFGTSRAALSSFGAARPVKRRGPGAIQIHGPLGSLVNIAAALFVFGYSCGSSLSRGIAYPPLSRCGRWSDNMPCLHRVVLGGSQRGFAAIRAPEAVTRLRFEERARGCHWTRSFEK